MPLLDHFHPPVSEHRSCEGFHGLWAAALVEKLNRDPLADEYFADMQVHIGSQEQVDVAGILRNENIELFGGSGPYLLAPSATTYAVAYRPSRQPAGDQIELWPKVLTAGQPLPVLPLALRNAMTLPVDLEETYEEARQRSRLR